MSERTIKVYSGLTLVESDIRALLPEAEVAPPIERDDLVADVERGVNVVVIIDGRFHHARAVSPTEILDAIRAGVRVYGSSSMGALRAAELERHGMIGHGEVFERIKSTPFFRDDFVGQSFDPETTRPISAAYVDLQFAIERVVRDERPSASRLEELLGVLRDVHYSERTAARMKHEARSRWPEDRALLTVVDEVFSASGSQKRLDARAVLLRVQADLARIDRSNTEAAARLAAVGRGVRHV
jgi:hypothetical protein